MLTPAAPAYSTVFRPALKKMPARFEPGGHLVSYRNFIVPLSTRLLLERIALCLVDCLLQREGKFVSLLVGSEGQFGTRLRGREDPFGSLLSDREGLQLRVRWVRELEGQFVSLLVGIEGQFVSLLEDIEGQFVSLLAGIERRLLCLQESLALRLRLSCYCNGILL